MDTLKNLLTSKTVIACLAAIGTAITGWTTGELSPVAAILAALAAIIGILLRNGQNKTTAAAAAAIPPAQAVQIGVSVLKALQNVSNLTPTDRVVIDNIAAKLGDDLKESSQ